MSVDTPLHALLHVRFQEVFGPPHHDLYDTEQWSLAPADGQAPVHVLLNGTSKGPLVWVFNSHDPQNKAKHFAVTQKAQIDELIEHLQQSLVRKPEPANVRPPRRRPFLEDVLTTEQLASRPSRPPGYAAENEALLALAHGMTHDPQGILQLTADIALHLCGAHSSGISILEKQEGIAEDSAPEVFRWHAIAGVFASHVGSTTPRESPCGTVVDRNALLMFDRPELHYQYPAGVKAPIEEVILAPFHAGGDPVGTVWVMAHAKDRKFDSEDARLLASVAQFAGAAYQVVAALKSAEAGRTRMTSARDTLAIHSVELEEIVAERTRELVETSSKLRLAERMATMGTLSAGLGHDMGNMGLIMRSRLEVMLKGAEAANEHAKVLHDCVLYIQNLASGLRLMALDPENEKLGPEAVSLPEWWLAAHRVLASGVTTGIIVESKMPIELPSVMINRAGLTQAVYNLVQNAVDAMKDRRGCITIAAELHPDRSHVLLSVSDEGPGMTDEVRRRCLDPLFTTKTTSTASGLGLALVHTVIKKAGGGIKIDTELGRGTTFTLILPVVT